VRYRDIGNLHKDFHLATHRTIRYVLDTYGDAFLRELLMRTAQRVYRAVYDALHRGDPSPLLEHWCYYHQREGSRFRVEETDEATRFVVEECAAVRHLKEHGVEPGEEYYRHIRYMNEGWSTGTPFVIDTVVTDQGGYIQTIRRR
jgi:hypothetical protein